MSDPKNRQAPTPGVDFVVQKAQLDEVDLDSMLSDTTSVDCIDLHQIIVNRMSGTKAELRQSLQLLSGLTDYHVEPDHLTEPFKPMFTMNGCRTFVPSDFLAEQIDVLAEFAPSIPNAGLRARMADVAWFVQRKRKESAETAVSAYCDCLEQVRDGIATLAFDKQSRWSVRAMKLLIRAARISHATKWELKSSIRLQELIRELVLIAYMNCKTKDFLRIVNVYISHGVSPDLQQIVAWSEDLVSSDTLLTEPNQRIELWMIAAQCYKRTKDENKFDQCMIEIAECNVQKADLEKSPMLVANFLNHAIEILHSCSGTKERREELWTKLLIVQKSIQGDMGTFCTEIDITKLEGLSVSSVKGHSWPKAFHFLVLCGHPPEPHDIRKEAQQHSKKFELPSTIPRQLCDFLGRLVFCTRCLTEEPNEREPHIRYLISFLRGLSRQEAVEGIIDPIRNVIREEHFVSVDVVQEMIKDSPFIPATHTYIFARAIIQFLAGEDVEAASLLVPQLENSLRHILWVLASVDTTTSDNNRIQTEASLSILLNPKNAWKGQLEKILPKRYIHEIDLLFNFAGGPSIRNQIAHGRVPASGFHHYNIVYASWMIIHIALLPLAKRWGDIEKTDA